MQNAYLVLYLSRRSRACIAQVRGDNVCREVVNCVAQGKGSEHIALTENKTSRKGQKLTKLKLLKTKELKLR